MSPNPRKVAGGVAAAVLGSGVTAALLLGPNPTSAAPPTTSEVAGTDDIDEPDDAVTESASIDRSDRLRELLQPLVDSGSLTEEEADAIVAELTAGLPNFSGPQIQVGPDIQVGPGWSGVPRTRGSRSRPGTVPDHQWRSHRRGHRHRRRDAARRATQRGDGRRGRRGQRRRPAGGRRRPRRRLHRAGHRLDRGRTTSLRRGAGVRRRHGQHHRDHLDLTHASPATVRTSAVQVEAVAGDDRRQPRADPARLSGDCRLDVGIGGNVRRRAHRQCTSDGDGAAR